MLVLNKSSTCDVCMEGYMNGGNSPHSISCGHTFCQKCLDHLLRHICPLCRTRFSPQDVRKLHIDMQSPMITTATIEEVPENPESSSPPPDNEARILQEDIARVVREGAKLPELRRVIEKCRTYYKSQSADQQNPVKVSALLLWNLAESQRHLAEMRKDKAVEIEKNRVVETALEDMRREKVAEVEKTCEAKIALEELRSRLTAEIVNLQVKYEELQRIRQDEKDTALAVEKSLREHYDESNSYWSSKVQATMRENTVLREELMRARIAFNPLPDFQRPVEVRYLHAMPEPKHPEKLIEDDPLSIKARAKAKAKAKAIEEEEFHLSPLAQVIGTWPSAIQSFRALVDEDEIDLKKTCGKKELELRSDADEDQTMGDSTSQLVPVPIPRSSLSRQLADASVSSSTSTANPDNWSGLSRSRPRDDIVMSSRDGSSSRHHSAERSIALAHSGTHSPSRRISRDPSTLHISSRTSSPSRRYSSDRLYGPRLKDTHSRDSYDGASRDYEMRAGDMYEPKVKDQVAPRQIMAVDDFRDKDRERLRAQLHDILDSPMPSSSLKIPMSYGDEPSFPPPYPAPPSSNGIPRQTNSNTRVHTPLRRNSTASQCVTPTPGLEEGFPATVMPKTLVHASSVAMQQEKERQERRERERQREQERERMERERGRERDREREREPEWQHLKDATNVPPDVYPYHRERRTGRTKLSHPVTAGAD